MKKFLLSLTTLLLVSTMLLTGCHGNKGSTKAFVVPDEFDITRNYTVSFLAKNDTNKAQVKIYEKAVEDFEKLYPNIDVNIKFYTDYNSIYNDVITNISTDTTPNVCITYPDHIATYLTGDNTVVALDSLIVNKDYGLGGSKLAYDSPEKSEISEKFLSECQLDGAYYALPFLRSSEACYINKTYVEAMGYEIPDTLTWDFVWEVSEAAMEKESDGETFKVNGQKTMIPFIYKSTDNMMIQMVEQLGSGYSTEEGDILLFNDTTRGILYTIAGHAQTRSFSTFKISSYPGNYLNAGQCIFAIDSTAGSSWMGSESPNSDIAEEKKRNFELEVKTIPQFNASDPKMISQGPSICLFNKEDPQEVLASWIFAQYLLTNDVQIAYAQTEGYIPVSVKAQNSSEYKDYLSREGEDGTSHYSVKIQASKLVLNNIDNTFVTPVFNGSMSLRNAAGELIESVTKSVRRKETIDNEYIQKLYSDTISLYRLDQITQKDSYNLDSPLPVTSKALIISVALAWIIIIACFVTEKIKSNTKEEK